MASRGSRRRDIPARPRNPEPDTRVIRFLLLAILLLVVARMFWRLVDVVIDTVRIEPGRRNAPAVKLVRDPVCGTYVAPRAALSLTTGGSTHYFCSEECRNKYAS